MRIQLYRLSGKAIALGEQLTQIYESFIDSEAEDQIRELGNFLNQDSHNVDLFKGDDLGFYIIKKMLDKYKMRSNFIEMMMDCVGNEMFESNRRTLRPSRGPGRGRPSMKESIKNTMPPHMSPGFIFDPGNVHNYVECYGVFAMHNSHLEEYVEEEWVEEVSESDIYGFMLQELVDDAFGSDLVKLNEAYNKASDKNNFSRGGCGDGPPTLFSWYIYNNCNEPGNKIMEIISKDPVKSTSMVFNPKEWEGELLDQLELQVEEFKLLIPHLQDIAVDFAIDLDIAIKGKTLFKSENKVLMDYFHLDYYTEGFSELEQYLLTKVEHNE